MQGEADRYAFTVHVRTSSAFFIRICVFGDTYRILYTVQFIMQMWAIVNSKLSLNGKPPVREQLRRVLPDMK